MGIELKKYIDRQMQRQLSKKKKRYKGRQVKRQIQRQINKQTGRYKGRQQISRCRGIHETGRYIGGEAGGNIDRQVDRKIKLI